MFCDGQDPRKVTDPILITEVTPFAIPKSAKRFLDDSPGEIVIRPSGFQPQEAEKNAKPKPARMACIIYQLDLMLSEEPRRIFFTDEKDFTALMTRRTSKVYIQCKEYLEYLVPGDVSPI